MLVVAPLNLSATNASPTVNDLAWTNGDTYDYIFIHRNGVFWKYIIGRLNATTDTSFSANVLYEYKLYGTVTGVGSSAFCAPDSCGYFTFTSAETVHVFEDPDCSVTVSPYSYTDVAHVTCEDIATCVVGDEVPEDFGDMVTDTVTCTDRVATFLITPQNYSYYLGTSNGMVHAYDEDETGDNGVAINAYWKSKRLDFSDIYPDILGTWKTISHIQLTYLDKGESTVTLSVSTDGGTTWESKTKTFGSGTLKTAEKSYHFWKTGRFFNFRVSNVSSAETFQLLRLTAHFTPQAEQFATA
jgi:hypothetical protein